MLVVGRFSIGPCIDRVVMQVEERLRFYETGETPRKNVDVMHKVGLGCSMLYLPCS